MKISIVSIAGLAIFLQACGPEQTSREVTGREIIRKGEPAAPVSAVRKNNYRSLLDLTDEDIQLTLAMHSKDIERAKKALYAGASADAVDFNGTSALGIAIRNDYEEGFELLLARGADPNMEYLAPSVLGTSENVQVFPLYDAVDKRNVNFVESLFASEAKVETCRHAELGHCVFETITTEIIDRNGVRLDDPIAQAEILDILVAEGFDARVYHPRTGETPLIKASRIGNVEAVNLLLDETDANVNAIHSIEDKTSLDFVLTATYPIEKRNRIRESLLRKNAQRAAQLQ